MKRHPAVNYGTFYVCPKVTSFTTKEVSDDFRANDLNKISKSSKDLTEKE